MSLVPFLDPLESQSSWDSPLTTLRYFLKSDLKHLSHRGQRKMS